MKRLIAISAVMVVLAAFSGPAHAGVSLSTLFQPGATITSGNNVFSNFGGWSSTISAADITVTPWQNPTNQGFGLMFTSDVIRLTSGGGLNVTFNYLVTSRLPGHTISANTITVAGSPGGGNFTVIETARNATATGTILATKILSLTAPAPVHVVYTPAAVPTVHVNTLIMGSWSGTSGSGPQLTAFTQTFIPEPATVAILGLGGVLLRRRKR